MQFNIETFGCKVNQYESEKIAENLVAAGFIQVTSELATVIVINSCMVTEIAENKVKKHISKLKRQGKYVALTGCMANKGVLTQADISLKNTDIVEYLTEHFKDKAEIGNITHGTKKKTRKFIKIQDGCNRFCSYCIIPYARNKMFSKPLEDILKEVKEAANNGYKEIVLIGINIGAYNGGIHTVIEKCAEIEGIERIRLGSLEPDLFTDIERLSKIPKLCPHFHLSLQSGSNRILSLMNRHYTSEDFSELVENLRKYFPDCSITTDIIVGFPTETETEFLETVEFAKKVKFSKIHVFPYSKRSGTAAAEMEQVDEKIKAQRADILKSVSAELEQQFYNSQIGKTYPVLFEREKDNNFHIGHTPNFLTIKIPNIEKKSFQGKILLTTVK
ncbi:MAG: tRNA (N(6)-L-threonylcarbamoyladenosine(37)-C(2))-methylthiotransferase MtaB [Oscillospiraceae bacterium]|jgi:threonylcarbamoyladenosine tRNA methylthiotransferase MtaB|nr:tRNA (N(6)-L-threonylcarbamoyladenosine(37)-C(2))-methylthiotransferase MtaB [Oscillospiraceae bacterium]